MKRIAMASVAGTALEYYDFAVYNTLAALVFNKLFFPTFDPLSGTLLAFATFWVGYLSRPFGGILFGHLGDRHGRRFVLVITLLLMGVTTMLIGLLPTYAQIGALAPILLVSLRFLQGMALGGEWAGAVLLCVEHGSDKQRGRNASFAQMGPSIGTLVASGAIALTSAFIPQEQWLEYGWRLPLLASVVLVAFGLWLRMGVTETPQFTALQERVRAPLGEVVRHHWRRLLIAGGVRMGPDVMYSLLAVFLLSYITTTLSMSRTLAVTALTIGAAFNAVLILVAGLMSDRFGRRAIYGAGAAVAVVWLFVLFPLLDSKAELAIIIAIVSGLSIHAFMYGPQAAFIAEQFPTQVRYAGSSLAYTLGGVVAGGMAPLAFQALYRAYGTPMVVVWYAVAALLVTLFVLWLAVPGRVGVRQSDGAGSVGPAKE
jgi:MFS family permease